MNPPTHFHIRWSGGSLDWEHFESRAEAEANATQLARIGETYTFEEYGEACPQCRKLMKHEQADCPNAFDCRAS